jgi:hypothetical protein
LFAEIPERRERRERRKPRRMLWGVALVAGLAAAAAVGVYWTYPPARTRASEWLATGETLAKTAMSRVTEALSKAERQAPVVAPTAEVAPPPAADVAAESASSTPATARSVVESSAPVEPPKQPEPEPEQNQPATAAAPPAPVRAVEPEIVEFAASVVTVSESTGVATAAIRRRGGTLGESSFAWWTSDGSALADDDYANLGARIEKFAAGEQTRAIYIPLVSDSKAESRETFYVNLREGEQLGRGRDQAEQIEIVVLDDD